jgi:hypothetical protein
LTRHDERAGTSDPASRLSASGAVPITIIERNGGCTIITGKTTTGTVAARWWIAAQDAPRVAAQARQFAGSPRTYRRHGHGGRAALSERQ